MFSPALRLCLILASVAFGVHQLLQGNTLAGMGFLAGAGLLAWGHVRYGTVQVAFQRLQAGDVRGANRMLDGVKRPDMLASQHRAYYELIKGMLAVQEEAYEKAETHLRTALVHKLRTDNDKAIVEAHLAAAVLQLGKEEEAKKLIASAREKNPRPTLVAMLDKLESTIER